MQGVRKMEKQLVLKKWFIKNETKEVFYKFSLEFFEGWYGARMNLKAMNN